MEYYGNALCVSYDDLVGGGIMTASNLQKMAQRGKLKPPVAKATVLWLPLTPCLRSIRQK